MANYKEYLFGHELEVYKECILPDMAKYFYEQGDYDRAISLYEDLYSYRVVEQKNLDASTFLHMNSLITILLNESNYDRIKEIICTTAEDTPEMKSILAQLVIHTRADRWLVEYHKSVSSTYDSNHPAVFYSLTNLEDTFMKQADYRFIYHLEQFKIMAYVKTNEDNNESISNMLLECLNSICGTGESYKTIQDWNDQFQVNNQTSNDTVNLDLVNYLKYFGDFFHQRAQYETARILLRKAIDVSSALSESDPDYSLWNDVSDCYLKEGSIPLACGILRESVDHMEDRLGSTNKQVLAALESLIKLYYSEKMYDDAELISIDLLYRLETAGEKPTYVAEVKGKLASLYQLQHKYDFAIPLLEELVVYHKDVHGDKSADTLSSLHDLASALLHHGTLEKSKSVYEECCNGYIEVLGNDHATTVEAIKELKDVQNAIDKLHVVVADSDGSNSPSKTQEIVKKFLSTYESTVEPKAKFSRVMNLFTKNIARPSHSPSPVSALTSPMSKLKLSESTHITVAATQSGPETETESIVKSKHVSTNTSIMQKYTKSLLKGHTRVTVATEPARILTMAGSSKAITNKSSKSSKAERAGRTSSKKFRRSIDPATASTAKEQELRALTEEEFTKSFGMDRAAFCALKTWKQTALRKEKGFF